MERSTRKILRMLLTVLVILTALIACRLPSTPEELSSPDDPLPSLVFTTPTATITPIPTPTATPEPAARIASGDEALFHGDYQAAREAFQAAFEDSQEAEVQAAARLGLGRVHYYEGDYPNALDILRSMLDNYPGSTHQADAYYFLGRIYDALTRYTDAAAAYRAYRGLRPGVIDAYISELSGDALFAAADYSGALADYQVAAQSERLSLNFSLEFKLASTYNILGDPTTAIIVYDDVYSRSANDAIKARANYRKGLTYAGMGDLESANIAYIDAVSNYPLAYDSYLALIELVNAGYPVDELQRGIVDYNAGEYGVAMAAFDRYLKAEPAFPATAHYYQGLIFRDQGATEAALEQWDIVIQNYPDQTPYDDAWEQKGFTQWAYMEDYLAGANTFAGFVEAAPAHPRAAEFLFNAGRVAERGGELELSSRLWERIPGEYPASEYIFRALFLAGISHYRIGDYPASQNVFLQAQAQALSAEERSASLLWIGKIHADLGNPDAARITWEQAAAMDPTGYYSERARDLILGREHFTPPLMFDLGVDLAAERLEAERWLRESFSLAIETDLSGLGNLGSDGRIQRGLEFWRLGEYERARYEFEDLRQSVTSDAADTYRLMNFFHDLGIYRSAILAARQVLTLAGMDDAGTMSAPRLFNHVRFGTYYAEMVIPAAQERDFHPLFIWSTMRQESLFEGFISSSAGARGLMQIIPSTGQEIYERSGYPENYHQDDLYRPVVSIRMGLEYLDRQRERFSGDQLAALAAYNGGPGNASVWKELAGDDPDLFVEVIRLEEPRDYVRRIFEIFTIYRRLYGRAP
jgi:soluble lytic murein transglycosylase